MVSVLPMKSKVFCRFREFFFRNLLFMIYVDDMPMAVKCNLPLYANDTCLVFQIDVKDIEKQLNKDFANICD